MKHDMKTYGDRLFCARAPNNISSQMIFGQLGVWQSSNDY